MKPNENQKVSLYNQAINQLKTPDDNFNRILFSSFVYKVYLKSKKFKIIIKFILKIDEQTF